MAKRKEAIPGYKLCLSYRDLSEIHPNIIEKFASRVSDLDLSNNNFTNIDSLKNFPRLETLVLDNNKITSFTGFPKFPRLVTLWVNCNSIANLALFIDTLVESVPNIKYLSMLGNEACPNFLNGGSLSQYNDYRDRKYVINHLHNLTQLDADPISTEERMNALKSYGNLPAPFAKEEEFKEESKKVREEREKQDPPLSEVERLRIEQLETRRRNLERRKKKQELAKRKSLMQQKEIEMKDHAQNNSTGSIFDLLPDVEEDLPKPKVVPPTSRTTKPPPKTENKQRSLLISPSIRESKLNTETSSSEEEWSSSSDSEDNSLLRM